MKNSEFPADFSFKEFTILLSNPDRFGNLITKITQKEIRYILNLLVPGETEFIMSYSHFLDRYSTQRQTRGKVGLGLPDIKWKLIFSYLLSEDVSFFQRKYFIYNILSQLAAHYNQNLIDLLDYFPAKHQRPIYIPD